MKKLILILTIILGIYSISNAQFSNGKECTYCKGNETGEKSSALGTDNISTATYSLASGYKNQTTGDYSHAFGYMNTVSNFESFAAGYNNSSNGIASICLGTECTTFGKGAFAAGMGSKAYGVTSFALGQNVMTGQATSNAFVIGEGNNNTAYLVNEVAHSLMIGFKSTKPTFFVSQAPGYNKTGRIGIGNITAPEAKLHIKADIDEDASLYLQPTGTGNFAKLFFGDMSHSIIASEGTNMEFNITTGNDFIFNTGNVGIGTTTPAYPLDVAGDIRFTGQLYDANGLFKPSPWESNGNDIYYSDGSIGIGTDTPLEQLQIGDRWTFHNGGNKVIGYNYHWDGTNSVRLVEDEVSIIQFTASGNINFKTASSDVAGSAIAWNNVLSLSNDGSIGMGTTAYQSGYLLTIDGKVMAEEVKIQNSDQWYDFVFDEDYELPSLTDIENFVKENKHLPDIPSSQEVAENGYELGEMNGILLKKVEELTLYVIEQQKEIEKLKKAVGSR